MNCRISCKRKVSDRQRRKFKTNTENVQRITREADLVVVRTQHGQGELNEEDNEVAKIKQLETALSDKIKESKKRELTEHKSDKF